MRLRHTSRLLVALLLTVASIAQTVQAERPKIGLALSGGGAKGSAHIAVLELLEANNIPVDYIAGTSIGAYIGGLYALGHSAEEIRNIMYNADLGLGFSDAIDREKLPFRLKRQHDKFNAGLEAGYREAQIRIPFGVLYGQSMSSAFRRSLGNIPSFDSFDDLAIPFRAIATNLADSSAVLIDSGDMLRAMKASAAVPGALVPVSLQGKLLVDGGMAENLPVTQVREMGADIIIAVDISSPLVDSAEINNVLAVLDQITNFLTIQNIEEQKKRLDPNDIYIRPQVDDLSTSDFSQLNLAYDAGEAAAQQKLNDLGKLSISDSEYQQYQDLKRQKLFDLKRRGNMPVVEIILDNQSSFNEDYLLHALGLRTGYPISTGQLLNALDRLYSLDQFERVEASFEDREQGRVLVVEIVEKSWGPNFLEFGIGWEDDFTLDSVIDLDFAYTLGNITDNNGEWRNELSIGTDKGFRSELYLPIDRTQRFFQSTVFENIRRDQNIFIENERALILEQISRRLDLGLGYKLNQLTVIEAGIVVEGGEFDNSVFFDEDVRYQSSGVFVRYGYDSLDRISFPTRGNRITLSITHRDEDVRGEPVLEETRTDDNYRSTQYLLDWKAARSLGNHGLIGEASFAYLDSETDQSVHLVQLGGFLNLSGYHRDALIGNNKVFAAIAYQYNLGKSLFGLKNFPIYVGASLETGNVWTASDSITADELIAAGSFYLSTDSKLGPIALAVGHTDDGQDSVYFYLGKNI